MKFSYNWIRELVDGLDLPAAALERLITLKTAECEGIEPVGELLDCACLARVESVEPIAESHNVKAVVDVGRQGRKTVVCGAKNCRPGIVAVYAAIGKKTIAGVESDGMLASAAELGISRDHEGILELTGRSAIQCPGCAADFVIEIDNKSITHRPDLWGHHGMAREVAAIAGGKLKDPAKLDLLPQSRARRECQRWKISISARDIARWLSKTSLSAPRRFGCSSACTPSALTPSIMWSI